MCQKRGKSPQASPSCPPQPTLRPAPRRGPSRPGGARSKARPPRAPPRGSRPGPRPSGAGGGSCPRSGKRPSYYSSSSPLSPPPPPPLSPVTARPAPPRPSRLHSPPIPARPAAPWAARPGSSPHGALPTGRPPGPTCGRASPRRPQSESGRRNSRSAGKVGPRQGRAGGARAGGCAQLGAAGGKWSRSTAFVLPAARRAEAGRAAPRCSAAVCVAVPPSCGDRRSGFEAVWCQRVRGGCRACCRPSSREPEVWRHGITERLGWKGPPSPPSPNPCRALPAHSCSGCPAPIQPGLGHLLRRRTAALWAVLSRCVCLKLRGEVG